MLIILCNQAAFSPVKLLTSPIMSAFCCIIICELWKSETTPFPNCLLKTSCSVNFKTSVSTVLILTVESIFLGDKPKFWLLYFASKTFDLYNMLTSLAAAKA